MIFEGDCRDFLRGVKRCSVQTCITSPPYNVGKQYESRMSLSEYTNWTQEVIGLIVPTIADGGSVFWQVGNMVDNGEIVPLDALAYPIFKETGLRLRNRIVWTFGHGLHAKRRLSGRHETMLWFTKGDNYKFHLDAIRVPSLYPNKRYYKGPKKGELSGNPLGKNPGDVWDISNIKHNHPEKTAHPCQFPGELVRRAILATTCPGEMVIDPFMGSGTTAEICEMTGREWSGSERDPSYLDIIKHRIDAIKRQSV
jgi:adenine-specific DNA-methyltransferase